MFELVSLLTYLILQGFGFLLAAAVGIIFVYLVLHKLHSRKIALLLFLFFTGTFLFLYLPVTLPQGITYPFAMKSYGPKNDPVLPLDNVFDFFFSFDEFEKVDDIARNPADVPPAIERTGTSTVDIELTAKEVIGEMADGVSVNYWTFNGTVPGPMLRVREGDTVNLTLKNASEDLHLHNIDLHAVTGPGGGAAVSNVLPGEEKTFSFKALNPGLYIYHCAADNVANHMAHGMYGLILVEPEGGLPPVDKEFYVVQGEFYTAAPMGRKGLQIIDTAKMLNGEPEYVVFNGRTGGLNGKMEAEVGDRVRLYVGNGGVNFISSFHVIGEIFDTVYPEAAMGSEPFQNVQSTIVPAGGATIVEFDVEVPGDYVLVDHALARIDRGAWGVLKVSGEENHEIFDGDFETPEHHH